MPLAPDTGCRPMSPQAVTSGGLLKSVCKAVWSTEESADTLTLSSWQPVMYSVCCHSHSCVLTAPDASRV